jgi:isopentenyldiphosphate isomerase
MEFEQSVWTEMFVWMLMLMFLMSGYFRAFGSVWLSNFKGRMVVQGQTANCSFPEDSWTATMCHHT